jgi:hypothetical protein
MQIELKYEPNESRKWSNFIQILHGRSIKFLINEFKYAVCLDGKIEEMFDTLHKAKMYCKKHAEDKAKRIHYVRNNVSFG